MNSNESKKCFTVWENCLCITLGQSVKLYYERKRKLATRISGLAKLSWECWKYVRGSSF